MLELPTTPDLHIVVVIASAFMIQGKLKSGDKMFVIRTEHFVKLRDFSKHLTEHFYRNNEDFNTKLTKKEAEKILKRGLFFDGLNGEIEDGYFESSFEEGERWNKIYSDAYEWVKSKYEWLSS